MLSDMCNGDSTMTCNEKTKYFLYDSCMSKLATILKHEDLSAQKSFLESLTSLEKQNINVDTYIVFVFLVL